MEENHVSGNIMGLRRLRIYYTVVISLSFLFIFGGFMVIMVHSIVQMKHIHGDDFMDRMNDGSSGNNFHISNFGVKEFLCTGSCYCEEGNGRKASATSVYRGVSSVVSAITIVTAFSLSRDYFKKDCESMLVDTCDSGSILAEVDECDPIDSNSEGNIETLMKDVPVDKEDNPEKTKYICEGRCSPREVDSMLRIMEKKFDEWWKSVISTPFSETKWDHHPDYKDAGVMKKTWADLFTEDAFNEKCYTLRHISEVSVPRNYHFETKERIAEEHFMNDQLRKFCKSNSIISSKDLDNKGKYDNVLDDEERNYYQFYLKNQGTESFPVCVSRLEDLEQGENGLDLKVHRNIVCRRVFTEKEWEEGLPHQKHNLKHWKEGYLNPLEIWENDELTR